SDVLQRYCVACHNDKVQSAGVALTRFDLAHPGQQAELAERFIRKLRAGMMPPVGAPRPARETLQLFAASLEAAIDQAAGGNARPGRRTFQRLTNTEYRRSIRDLLDIDVDVSQFLPPDTLSAGFDNISDTQPISP